MNVVDQHATEIKRETTTKKPTMKASHKVMTTINHRVFVCVCLRLAIPIGHARQAYESGVFGGLL